MTFPSYKFNNIIAPNIANKIQFAPQPNKYHKLLCYLPGPTKPRLYGVDAKTPQLTPQPIMQTSVSKFVSKYGYYILFLFIKVKYKSNCIFLM